MVHFRRLRYGGVVSTHSAGGDILDILHLRARFRDVTNAPESVEGMHSTPEPEISGLNSAGIPDSPVPD